MNHSFNSDQRQVCAFTLGGHLFGIDVHFIQEVFRFQECTPVPLTPPLVTGLLNLRGQIVMAVDLRQRLGLGDRPDAKPPINIVVRIDDGVLSFLVDELVDIMTLSDEIHEQIPETLTETEKQFVTGCFKLNDRLLIMLDAIQVADISECLRDALAENRSTHAGLQAVPLSN